MGNKTIDKKKVGDSFSRRAKHYGTSTDHIAGRDLEYVELFLRRKHIDRALDISTGAGHTAGLLKKHCALVLAVDVAIGMLAEARNRYGDGPIRFVGGDAEHLPFAPGSFSLVTCRIAPHHFSDVRLFLRDVERVLGEEGFFLLIDSTVPEDDLLDGFLNRMEKTRDDTHTRSLRISEWEQLLEETGFLILDRKVFKKRHDFRPWLERANAPEERQEELIEMIEGAEGVVREYFQFEFGNGEILSYTDDKALFLSRKA